MTRATSLRGTCLCALPLALLACVSTSTHEAELARGRALESGLASREAELRDTLRELDETRGKLEQLEVALESLQTDRIAVLERYEDLRTEQEQVAMQLEQERVARIAATDQIQELSGTYQSLVDELEDEVQAGQIAIRRLASGVEVTAMDQILFDSGSADVKRSGRDVLNRLAARIKEIPGQRVRIEGHTDDVPIATSRFPSNWELSAARAAGIARAFEAAGVDPTRLTAVGYGPNKPVESNAMANGRSRNRRIEIILVPES
jgi:chemotaxis protein MotB